MKKQMQGMIYVMLAAVLFGVMPLWAVKVYDNGGNPVFLSFCRFALSLPLLYVLDRKLCPHHERTAPDRKFFLVCITYVLTPSLLFISYTKIVSGLATTVHFIYPAIVLLLCRAMFRQSIQPVKYFCCFLCIVGVALFCTVGEQVDGLGLLLALLSAITYAGYVAYLPASHVQETLAPFQLTLRLNLGGVVVLAVLNTLMGTWAFDLTLQGWLYTLLLSWGTAVGATMLFQRGVQLCGAQNAAIFSVLEPLTSVVCGILFLSESCSMQIILGIVLILAAVFILSICDFREKRQENMPA